MIPVFRRNCRKAGVNPLEEAQRLNVLSHPDLVVTSSTEMLFKQEGGAWRLVQGLTEPSRAGKDIGKPPADARGVPFEMKSRESRSVFN